MSYKSYDIRIMGFDVVVYNRKGKVIYRCCTEREAKEYIDSL